MLGVCRWLALEVKYIEPVASFYQDHLDRAVVEASDQEVILDAGGDAEVILRTPNGVPRGGLHTHYALGCPPDHYDAWWDHLQTAFDLHEVDFGGMRSLYLYDPEENCVEIAGSSEDRNDVEHGHSPILTGIFEVVFEVEDLPTAEQFYTDIGFDIVDRGDSRKRTRLTTGPFDIELWEPHLGLADARGGVHVDVGFEAQNPERAADSVAARTVSRESIENGVRIRDPDGHYLSLIKP